MRSVFIDCPPFLKELYDQGLSSIVPALEVNVGSPSREGAIRLLAGAAFAVLDHTNLDGKSLEACPGLKVIVFLGTGAASYIDLEAAERLGIRVRAYGGYGDQSVAEHALTLMLAAGRRIAAMDQAVRAGSFAPLSGIEFAGRTLGVVGTGGIGRVMARLGAGIGMRVVAWNRSGVPEDLPARAVDLDELLATADVVSLHLALSEATRGFLSADRLGRMRREAILVNTARGALVDEEALIVALRDGRLAHAALDVFDQEPLPADHPLLALPNVTLTPHAGFATGEASARLLQMALEILAQEISAGDDR